MIVSIDRGLLIINTISTRHHNFEKITFASTDMNPLTQFIGSFMASPSKLDKATQVINT
jgi:hypothetical protein